MENIEIIELYIHNQLSTDDKLKFEQRLKTDSEFAETYALYLAIEKNMQSNYDEQNEIQFKENLKPFQQEYFSNNIAKKEKGKIRNLFYYAAAAAAILVVVFILNPFNKSKVLSNEDLYAQYSPFEKANEITRGDNKDSIFNKAANYYNSKKFNEAIPYFEKVLDSNAQAHFLYSQCYVQTNQTDKAMTELNKLINGQSSYREKAEFYKALLYLKMNDVEKCKETLLKINRYSDYSDKADELYKKLK